MSSIEKLIDNLVLHPKKLLKSTGKLAKYEPFKGMSTELIQKAKDQARNLLRGQEDAEVGNYVAQLEDELVVKGDFDKGTFTSQVVSDFNPRSHEELAKLHNVDLTKYKISNYWSKRLPSGKFTSSVFCTERKLGDIVGKEEIVESIKEVLTSIKSTNYVYNKKHSNKAFIAFIADEHVGASVTDSLYPNEWNASEYYKRKSTLLDVITQQAEIHGNFDKIILCSMGDTLDGYNAKTTRGGHEVPQNMTNKQAIKIYVEINKFVWDDLIKLKLANSYEKYDLENSNHGGLGWDAAANIAMDLYLNTKYPFVKTQGFEQFIDSMSYGIHDFHLCHGKDEKYQKRNFPLHLDPRTESFIKEYLDDRDYRDKNRAQHFMKGDLHKFATEQGKFFSYNNLPSLFGGSAWVGVNFGKSVPGYCYAIVPEDSKEFNLIPYWF